LRAIGKGGRGGAFLKHSGLLGGGIARVARVFDDFQDLAFDDAADAIEIRAALAFDVAGVFRLAAQPENQSDEDDRRNSGERKPIVPISQEFFQRVPFPMRFNPAWR
jgi:hypothetical protein